MNREGCDMLIVQKYGGTSLAGMSRLRAAARRVTGWPGREIRSSWWFPLRGIPRICSSKRPLRSTAGLRREMDAYLAAGEQMSAGLMTMAIGAMGYSAVSLTGWQAGIPDRRRPRQRRDTKYRRRPHPPAAGRGKDRGRGRLSGRRSRGGHHHVGRGGSDHHGGSSGRHG